MGNNGEIFRLSDGSIWEVKYEYEYIYEYYPNVVICPSLAKLIIGDKSLSVELVSRGSLNTKKDSKQSNGWMLYEETSLKGTIRGTVKKGSIFKTLSGNIYEVTGITLQLVLELQPDVIVLKQGETFKLIINGFDEPVICKCLSCKSNNKSTISKKTISNLGYSELVDYLRNAKIIAQDNENTYLGKLSNEFNSESVFNEFGNYGNEFSANCIWNEFSTFGNEFNMYSPFNEFSNTPPMIIKDGEIIAYLTVNESIESGVPPNLIKALKDQF